MRGKITSGALMTSLVLHVVIALLVGFYLLTQTEQFKDLMGIEILHSDEPQKPKVGKFVVKPTIRPTVQTQNTVVGESPSTTPCNETVYPRVEFSTADGHQIFKPNRQGKTANGSEHTKNCHTATGSANRCDIWGSTGVRCS